jgi:hypothetical protein
MLISELTVYDFLKEKIKLPDADAKRYAKEMAAAEEKLHKGIDDKVVNAFMKEKDILATKDNITELKESILKLETKMEAGFKDNLKWIVGILLGAISLAVAIIKAF